VRRLLFVIALLSSGLAAPPAFEVASVRASPGIVGPDYNNRLTVSPNGITARNVTLERLIAEAYGVQLSQVSGSHSLKQNEYEVAARAGTQVPREQLRMMLRALLVERFHLKIHNEAREARVYELTIENGGPKLDPAGSGGFHFRGEMREFADILAVQLTIPAATDPNQPVRASASPVPVLDRTGLAGVVEFRVDIRPEIGTDLFTEWRRALHEQLGLRLLSRREKVEVVVVDSADRIPTTN
jgi:uncharacterized protein (TIGR03435 family)